jgi:hypothetical protein
MMQTGERRQEFNGAVASIAADLRGDFRPDALLDTYFARVNNIQPGPVDTDLSPAGGDWAVLTTVICDSCQQVRLDVVFGG